MKVTREQFVENRERILEVASRLFRQKGFDGVGIADIMKAAGLTHGGFYRHFSSKDDLLQQASRTTLNGAADKWNRYLDESLEQPLAAVLDGYLSESHRDRVGEGCMFAALGAEAARQSLPVRSIFTSGLKPQLDALTRLMPGRSRMARRRKALAAMAGMVGALVLARAVDDAELSNEILSTVSRDISAAADDHQ